jgi:hypothetical protein
MEQASTAMDAKVAIVFTERAISFSRAMMNGSSRDAGDYGCQLPWQEDCEAVT